MIGLDDVADFLVPLGEPLVHSVNATLTLASCFRGIPDRRDDGHNLSRVPKDPRLQLLEDARPLLMDALSPDGVTEVRYVAAFPQLDGVGVWLCTRGDAERDRLGPRNPRLTETKTILASVGFSKADLARTTTIAQSGDRQQVILKEAGSMPRGEPMVPRFAASRAGPGASRVADRAERGMADQGGHG